jgi:dienelactone hydrolase
MRRAAAVGLACAVALVAPVASAGPTFETVFFSSGDLKIEAYLYRPPGDGPFPALIYNHGSRPGFEREERPFRHIAQEFVPAGYVVLVVERRGYGKSDGEMFSREVGMDRGARFVNRLVAEAGDVDAGVDHLAKQSFVDKRRIAIMGWSLGGIVTVLTASRRTDVRAAIDQAAGALSWKSSPELQAKLREAAGKVQVPLLTMVAENDATTDAARAIDGAVRETTPHRLIVYPPFHASAPTGVAEGHLLFGPDGARIWREDALAWLARYAGQR